ncbi:MAG: hypothetical protein CBC73_04340 [Flavobacteriales bacterium TMED113]|nr:MAG: hypothetical protein CBC73_04340 [Flavobacteriales bacterium TMED113]
MINPIITLTSDYGSKDYFISAIKAFIYKEIESINIVDISHEITPFHLGECAYTIRNAYHHFPKGTVHIIGIDAGKKNDRKNILTKVDGHYFIGSDSGIFSLIFQNKKAEYIFEINNSHQDESTFLMKDIFAKTACMFLKGVRIDSLGTQIENFVLKKHFLPTVTNNNKSIHAKIIYIDRFGNSVTNISKTFFQSIQKNRNFSISLPRAYKIEKICKYYSDVPEGTLLALFNSAGFLEISINRLDTNEGGANSLLGIRHRDNIIIDFFEIDE